MFALDLKRLFDLKIGFFSTSWRGWITAVDIWRFLVVSGCRILVRTFSTFGSVPDRQKDNAWGGPPFSKSVGKWSRGSILGIPWCLNKFGLSKKKIHWLKRETIPIENSTKNDISRAFDFKPWGQEWAGLIKWIHLCRSALDRDREAGGAPDRPVSWGKLGGCWGNQWWSVPESLQTGQST